MGVTTGSPFEEILAICVKRTSVRLDKTARISHHAAAMNPPTAIGDQAAVRVDAEVAVRGVRPGGKKLRCEDCFFHQNMLCALEDKKPCPTFRPAHPDGLRPPRQLAFVFRTQRRYDPLSFDAPPVT